MDKVPKQIHQFEKLGPLDMREMEGSLPFVPGVHEVPGLSPSESEKGKRGLSAKETFLV